tara:strand:+ start:237 stop:413 length:177 start_codon:yes stop_codon:yes gene_type:complete
LTKIGRVLNRGGIMERIQELEKQIQMMWQGFEEGISVDEMNKRLFPEAFEEEQWIEQQ